MKVLLLSYVPTLCWKNAFNLHRAGHEVYVVTKDALTGLRFFPFIAGYETFGADFRCAPASITDFSELINTFCAQWKIDIIFPVEVDISALVWRAKEYLAAPTIPLYDARRRQFFTDKWNFFTFAQSANIPVPATILAQTPADIEYRNIRYPIIVKPAHGADSLGVARITSENQLRSHIQKHGKAFPFLLQEFIPGEDIVAALLVSDGRVQAWALHYNHGTPPVREFFADPEVLALSTRLVEAIDYLGVCVIDVRRDDRDNSLKLIEINTRFGGSELHYANVGVNFSDLAVRLANGEDLNSIFVPARNERSSVSFRETLLAYLSGTFGQIAADIGARLWRTLSAPLRMLFRLRS